MQQQQQQQLLLPSCKLRQWALLVLLLNPLAMVSSAWANERDDSNLPELNNPAFPLPPLPHHLPATEPADFSALSVPAMDASESTVGFFTGPSQAAEKEFQRGGASWYGPQFHGRRTASGERYDMHALTAAHPTLPFGTWVRVRSLVNGREVTVRITDRGPYAGGRIIDLSRAAAVALDMLGLGIKAVGLVNLGTAYRQPSAQGETSKSD